MCSALLVARMIGLELVRNTALTAVRRRSQFYIRDMLAWMTALAVSLSVMRSVPHDWIWLLSIRDFIAAFGGLGLVAGASILNVLGRRSAACTDRAYAAGGRRRCLFACRGRAAIRSGSMPSDYRIHGRVVGRVALAGPAGRLSAHVAVAIQPRGSGHWSDVGQAWGWT